jgi:hypothetical protein
LEKKVEMMEKNHKHEIGVEMAHHRETQKILQKASEENRELKIKLEVGIFFSSIIIKYYLMFVNI